MRTYLHAMALVRLDSDERRQDITLVGPCSALLGLEDLLQAAEYPLQVVIVSDRLNSPTQ